MRSVGVAVAVTLLAFGGCLPGGVPPQKVQAWVGRPAGDLVREWGTPTRDIDDAGQRVLIYEEFERTRPSEFQRQVTVRQAGSQEAAAAANLAAQGPNTYARSYLFWVDPSGAIVRAEIRQR
jgi:hypothetical protein